jgi:hypothetical protein
MSKKLRFVKGDYIRLKEKIHPTPEDSLAMVIADDGVLIRCCFVNPDYGAIWIHKQDVKKVGTHELMFLKLQGKI